MLRGSCGVNWWDRESLLSSCSSFAGWFNHLSTIDFTAFHDFHAERLHHPPTLLHDEFSILPMAKVENRKKNKWRFDVDHIISHLSEAVLSSYGNLDNFLSSFFSLPFGICHMSSAASIKLEEKLTGAILTTLMLYEFTKS